VGKRNRPRKKSTEENDDGIVEQNPYEDFSKRMMDNPRILWQALPPENVEIISARMDQRQGKKTVVILGTSPDSCGLAPWNEPGIDEFWGLNDAHHLPFMHMDKITKWFQLHQPWRYKRPTPRYGAAHWEWMQRKQDFPIYMQRVDEDVPSSVEFPLYETAKKFLFSENYNQWLLGRGLSWQRKYYACSFSYMAALAYLEGFERVEMYGCELAQETEYYMQRPNTEFWIGLGVGLGVQFYVPAITRILQGVFYGYRYPTVQDFRQEVVQRKEKGTWEKGSWEPGTSEVDEDNVGVWPEPAFPIVPETEFGGMFAEFENFEPVVKGYAIDDEPSERVPEVVHDYGMDDMGKALKD
jgi:hypothetical protein